MDSLEWWGQNSFFSRTAPCSGLTLCVDCIGYDGGHSCTWCASDGGSCVDTDALSSCRQSLFENGCVVNAAPTLGVDEDTPASINVDALFFIRGETNDTSSSLFTSDQYEVSPPLRPTNGCTAEYFPQGQNGGGFDEIVMTPRTDYVGECRLRISMKEKPEFSQLGRTTVLVSEWTVTFGSVNDEPFLLEGTQSFDDEVGAWGSRLEDVAFTSDLCDLVRDTDRDSLTITLSERPSTGTSVFNFASSYTCTCANAGSTCVQTFVPNADAYGTGDIDLSATDLDGAQVTHTWTYTVEQVNDAPFLANPFAASYTYTETTGTDSWEASPPINIVGHFDDVDLPDDFLSCEVLDTDGLSEEASPGVDGNGDVTFRFNTTASGTSLIEVTCADGSGATATASFNLVVTEVNDPIELTDTEPASVSGAAGRGVTASIQLSDYFQDEESSFTNPDSLITCETTGNSNAGVHTTTIDGSDVTVLFRGSGTASVTITCYDQGKRTGTTNAAMTLNIESQNEDPVVIKNFDALSAVPTSNGFELTNPTAPLFLDQYFSDPNGNALTYTTSSNTSRVQASVQTQASSQRKYLRVLGDTGAEIIGQVTVTAQDGNGGSVSSSFLVSLYKVPVCTAIDTIEFVSPGPYTLNLDTKCAPNATGSLSYSVTPATTIPTGVSATIEGSNLVISSSDPCTSASFGLSIKATTITTSNPTPTYTTVPADVQITAGSVSAQTPGAYKYMVSNSTINPTLPTGYDGFVYFGAGSSNINITLPAAFLGGCGGASTATWVPLTPPGPGVQNGQGTYDPASTNPTAIQANEINDKVDYQNGAWYLILYTDSGNGFNKRFTYSASVKGRLTGGPEKTISFTFDKTFRT